MNVVVTGATGFIGRALVLRLLGAGHRVTALARDATRARDVLPAGASAVALGDEGACAAALAAADGVVHLAGENIAGGRWTRRRRELLRRSRIDLTRRLVELIDARKTPLPVLVSASAVGWYGGERFVDAQLRGPYRAWWHEHRFSAEGSRTIMEDVVHYALPLGELGRVAHPFVRATLRRIFAFRSHAIRARFAPRRGAEAPQACPARA